MFRVRSDYAKVKQGDIFGRRKVIGVPFMCHLWANNNSVVCCVVECCCGSVSVACVYNLFSQPHGCYTCTRGQKKRTGPHREVLAGVLRAMESRCYRKTSRNYRNYGARGIRICNEWRRNIDEFERWALSSGYVHGLQIERKEVNGDYCPDNCCWVTCEVQQNNRRNNIRVAAWGEEKTVQQWSRDSRSKVSGSTIHNRINRGINPELAISAPSWTRLKPEI